MYIFIAMSKPSGLRSALGLNPDWAGERGGNLSSVINTWTAEGLIRTLPVKKDQLVGEMEDLC